MTAVDVRAAVTHGEVSPPAPAVTVLIPTFNESGNVAELVRQLVAAVPAGVSYEILFVDDSTDDTPDVVRRVAAECPVPVDVLHRDTPTDGLGGAVLAGLRAARSDWVVVMDGDLQHPPEVVPQRVAAGADAGADLVVATRYADGDTRGGLANRYRQLVSRSSTVVTRLLFPRRLAAVSDPMSGFFAVRPDAIDIDGLRPLGFKIMLELIMRNRMERIVEVPFEFRARHAGESKSSLREGVRFVRHLAGLRIGNSSLSRTLAFGAIGLSGFVPNLGVLWLLTSVLGLHYVPAAVLSTQVAIFWNFALLDLLVFTEARRWRLRRRLLSFVLLNNIDLVLRIPLLTLLVEQVGLGVLPGTAVTLLAAFALRFLVTDRMIYLRKRVPAPS
jgi:dolichol-phosphate mannosyltransferase